MSVPAVPAGGVPSSAGGGEELIAAASATAVVSVDTGLSHLTAALDRPNITLYGPTDPGLIGGYGKNQYICRPEHSSQLSDLSAAAVFAQLEPLLAAERAYV